MANTKVKAEQLEAAQTNITSVGTLTGLTLSGSLTGTSATFTTANNLAQLTLTSTDADASVGPRLDLKRDSSSPAVNDELGRVSFLGEDSGGASVSYALLRSYIQDPTDGDEDGKFQIETRLAGVMRERILMNATETVFNNEQLDLDFRIESDGNANMFVVDASADAVGIGIATPTSTLDVNGSLNLSGALTGTSATFTTADNTSQLTIVSTDADASVGPRFDLRRDSATPEADDTLGQIRWLGKDSGGASLSYAHMATYISDATDGAEDGKFEIDTRIAGTNRSRLLIHSTSTVFNQDGMDVDFRIESNNKTAMFFINAGNDRVGIGTDTPAEMLELEDSVDGEVAVKVTNDSTGSSVFAALFLQGQGNNFRIKNWGDGTSKANVTEFVSTAGSSYFAFLPGNSEKMRIANDGKVGIGSDSPDSLVHIAGSGGTAVLTLENKDTGLSTNETIGQINFETQDSGGAGVNAYIKAAGANTSGAAYLAFGTGTGNSPVERLRIDNSGVLLHGTTSVPTGVQMGNQIVSSSASGAEIIAFRADTSVAVDNLCGAFLIGNSDTAGDEDHFVGMWGRVVSANGSQELRFAAGRSGYETNTPQMIIASSGSIGAPSGTNIYNASDARLKQNINSLSDSLNIINNLNPVSFNWVDNFEDTEKNKTLYGFVAQEVQDVFPDAVEDFSGGGDIDLNGETIENPLRVNEKFIIPLLVKAIQEQQTQIEALQAEVKALKGS